MDHVLIEFQASPFSTRTVFALERRVIRNVVSDPPVGPIAQAPRDQHTSGAASTVSLVKGPESIGSARVRVFDVLEWTPHSEATTVHPWEWMIHSRESATHSKESAAHLPEWSTHSLE